MKFKIQINNASREVYEALQLIAFDNGYKWISTGKNINLQQPIWMIFNAGEHTLSTSDSERNDYEIKVIATILPVIMGVEEEEEPMKVNGFPVSFNDSGSALIDNVTITRQDLTMLQEGSDLAYFA